MMVSFSVPPLPPDLIIADDRGALTPHWHRFFMSLQQASPKQVDLATQFSALVGRVSGIEGRLTASTTLPDAANSGLAIATANAAGGAVALTDTLINEIKADFNTHISEFNSLTAKVNEIHAALRALDLIKE